MAETRAPARNTPINSMDGRPPPRAPLRSTPTMHENNHGNKSGADENANMATTTPDQPELKQAEIDGICDLVDAMDVAEKYNVDIGGLNSDKDVKTRMQCHLNLKKNGNYKEKIERQIYELGKTDAAERERLSRMIRDLRNIFPSVPSDEVRVSAHTQHVVVEELLHSDGSTVDIRNDCHLRLESLKEKECVILVSGESSAGKSSLLNLFLGENILPSHTLPCTSCITVIKYDQRRHANVIYRDGKRVTIPDLDKRGLEQLQQRAYYSAVNSADDVYSRRKEEHDVAEIQVFLPLPMLRSGVVLVDTPGIGENEFLENYLIDYISTHQILGFMYIIMTENALGIAEDRLVNLMSLIIKSQKHNTDVVRFDPKAALFVCNRWDLVPDEHKKAVKESALKQLSKAWPDFDPKNAVFFSTFQAQRELEVHPGYITSEFIALLHGFHSLVMVSQDKRIQASYRWLGTVLQRSVHYLRTMVLHLDMSSEQRNKKTQETKQKLKTLKEKADGVIKRLYTDMEDSVNDICQEVRNYLKTMQAKTKLTHQFGSKEGELPDMERASGTWDWVKRHIDTAFDSRLTDLLAEWDNEGQVINKIEKKLFREAKLELCDLEHELAALEKDASTNDTRVNPLGQSGTYLNNLCQSIENFEDDDEYEVKVPKKIVHQIRSMFSKTMRKKNDHNKMKEFEKDSAKIAKKRAEKLLEKMIKTTDERLIVFVREFLHRPFTFIRSLKNKLPSLIQANMTLLAKFEKAHLEDARGQKQYCHMMTQVETMRRGLLKYGERHYSFINDFGEEDIEIISQYKTLRKNSSLMEFVRSPTSTREQSVKRPHQPHGYWHQVHIGKITKGSQTRFVVVKLYENAVLDQIPNMQQEVAKLRCLLHTGVSIAEFLGVYHMREVPIPALIFAGKLMSVKNYMKIHPMDRHFDTTKVLRDVLAGLQYIHAKGLVHLELTRDSVTVSDIGEVKLTGACLPRMAPLSKLAAKDHCKEFVYLAPEVLDGCIYLPSADVFSFTLLCLEVKTHGMSVFSDVRIQTLTVQEFQRISAMSYLSEAVMALQLPVGVLHLLVEGLHDDHRRRPTTVDISKEFDNKKIVRRNTAAPRSIFARSSIMKAKKN